MAMEQIYWVKNGELTDVNKWLQKGGRVKLIQVVSENVAAFGCAGGKSDMYDYCNIKGDIYAYIVVEFD